MKKIFNISNFIKIIAIISFGAILGGCLQDNVLIKLNRDGGGTIEETLILLYHNDQDRKNPESIIEEVITAARQNEKDAFGENVKLISVTPVVTDQGAGAKAVYKFADINNVSINRNPLSRTAGILRDSGNDDDNITFAFSNKSPAHLTISMFPKEWLEAEYEAREKNAEDHDNDASTDGSRRKRSEQEMLLRNGRLNITIAMPTKILKTNATYQSGKKLTLIDLSLATLLEKNSAVGKLLDNPRLIKKYANKLKETKDCRIELNTPVTVEFK